MRDTPEFTKFAKTIKPEQITKDMVEAYTEYLQTRSRGEGAKSIYARFKKIIKHAVEQDIIRKNPCNNIVIKVGWSTIKKRGTITRRDTKTNIYTLWQREPKYKKSFYNFVFIVV